MSDIMSEGESVYNVNDIQESVPDPYNESENWTKNLEYVIPVDSYQFKDGYENIGIILKVEKENRLKWERLIGFMGRKTSQRHLFLVRMTPAFTLKPISRKFTSQDYDHLGEKVTITFIIKLTTENAERVAQTFPDDPVKQVITKMFKKVRQECERIKSVDIGRRREQWENLETGLPSEIDSQNQWGLKVAELEISVGLPEKARAQQRAKSQIEWEAFEQEKEVRRRKIEAEQKERLRQHNDHIATIESEERQRDIQLEQQEKALKERLENERKADNAISGKNIELELAKRDDEIKINEAQTDLSIRSQQDAQQIKTEFIRSLAASLAQKYANGSKEEQDVLQAVGQFLSAAQNSIEGQSTNQLSEENIETLLQKASRGQLMPANEQQEGDPWHSIPLKTKRLPVRAEVYAPSNIEVGEFEEIIFYLHKQPEFDDDTHHEIIERWKVRVDDTERTVKRFTFNEKENAYTCQFEVSSEKEEVRKIGIRILDEDESGVGKLNLTLSFRKE